MRRRAALAAALIGLAGLACDAGSRPQGGLAPGGGRVVVQRIAGRSARIADGPGLANYCPDDSLLVVIVLGRSWTGGLAMKALLPLGAPSTFSVQPSVGALGTAHAAFRPLQSGRAEFGTGGTIELESGREVSGRFEVPSSDSGGAPVVFRGRLSDVPVQTLPKGSCGT